MSPELHLLLSPRDAYAGLARRPRALTPVTALRRPAHVALVMGLAVAIATTGRVTVGLVVSTTLCWSLLVGVQMAIALPLIAGPARRTVGIARALDLFFAGHAPWSLWLLVAAVWVPSPLGPSVAPLLWLALVPLALTQRIILAFFHEVLEVDPRVAVARTVAHQAVTWGLSLVLFGIAVQIWPRALVGCAN